jgi:hypothetical protein
MPLIDEGIGNVSHPPQARLAVSDGQMTARIREPLYFSVDLALEEPLWMARTNNGIEFTCQRISSKSTTETTAFVATLDITDSLEFDLIEPITDAIGISSLVPVEADAFVRLDTGYFDLELCSGTAEGTGASKWGLRHFSAKFEGIDLLPSGNNAIGGFYGPFFTPENGLINPPEHVVADIEVIEAGPVMHRYRLSGVVPDGLLPELRNKRFMIDWTFTYGTPFFTRTYLVDPFETVINGRYVDNKITVGDEFESGLGDTVFNRFASYDGTPYRSGDPYAEELAEMVHQTLADDGDRPAKFEEFKTALAGDMTEAHWDMYWKLFCSWEAALEESEIRRRLAVVRASSHRLADASGRTWTVTADSIDVSAEPEQTIFPGAASKTVEFDAERGRAMVWWTSKPSGAFQIVQRPGSGWVNWGTNGENECPELPVGVEIKTAYGPFVDSWREVADGLETPPTVMRI